MNAILALDLSLTATGWALWNQGRTQSGVIKGEGTGMDRVSQILHAVAGLAWDADLVVIEGYSYASRGQAVVSLGELGGVVRHHFHSTGKAWVEVPPTCRAKYATGNGNASKEHVLAEAIRRLGYAGHSHDEADALWILNLALDSYGVAAVKVPQGHRSVLDRIQWPKVDAA